MRKETLLYSSISSVFFVLFFIDRYQTATVTAKHPAAQGGLPWYGTGMGRSAHLHDLCLCFCTFSAGRWPSGMVRM